MSVQWLSATLAKEWRGDLPCLYAGGNNVDNDEDLNCINAAFDEDNSIMEDGAEGIDSGKEDSPAGCYAIDRRYRVDTGVSTLNDEAVGVI